MAERIPTDEVERLLAEMLPTRGIEAALLRDLAADLLDARRENERLREALETILTYAPHVRVGGAQSIARVALSGEETSG